MTVFNPLKKAPVNIWCKIYTNNFSEEMTNRVATGEEIYDFLMEDSGNCFDDDGNPIKGDINLWYLGCNEKFGSIIYRNRFWQWSFGESSFDYVEQFVNAVYQDGLFTERQYQRLLKKIEEGREIGDMYKIADYLAGKTGTKKKSTPTIKTEKENSYV